MKLVIIGAEAAGASAAAKAKRTAPHADVTIYEKSEITSFGACGLPYFIGDHFDDPDEMISRTTAQFVDSGITVKTGHEVLAITPAGKSLTVRDLASGQVFEDRYDRLMIVTGASPIVPPIENLNLGNVFTVNTLADGLAVKRAVHDPATRNVVIVGADFIGLEVAEAMVELGKNVRIIQLDDRVLPDLFDREMTALIEAELKRADVSLHLGESVRALRGTGHVSGVMTDKGDYAADLVIIATGVRPNTMPFRNMGIDMMPNGAIRTDASGQASLPDVYVAGDCAAVHHLGRGGQSQLLRRNCFVFTAES